MESTPRVAIAGGGIGGLALAQGLLAAGVEVQLYERDPSPAHRRQGYRIHIGDVGTRALAEVLPDAVHRRVVDTATRPGDLLAGFDSRLEPLFSQVFPVTDPEAITAVDRYAFRRALMTGLDEVIHFGHDLEGYVETDSGIELRFTDGRRATADVLVGADGVGSRVRAQLLPDLDVVDIGVRCLYGKIPLAGVERERIPAGLPPRVLLRLRRPRDRRRVRARAVPGGARRVRRLPDGRRHRHERRPRPRRRRALRPATGGPLGGREWPAPRPGIPRSAT